MGLNDLVNFGSERSSGTFQKETKFKTVTKFGTLNLVTTDDGVIVEAHKRPCSGQWCSASEGACLKTTKSWKGDKLKTCNGELVVEFKIGGATVE